MQLVRKFFATLKSIYRRHTAKIRAVGAWIIGGLYLVTMNSPDAMATWTARRWAFEALTKFGPGVLLLMGAGDRNPPLAPVPGAEPPKAA